MWTWEQICTNEIEIKLEGKVVAQIIADNDCEQEHFDNANFIVNACNAYENRD